MHAGVDGGHRQIDFGLGWVERCTGGKVGSGGLGAGETQRGSAGGGRTP